MNESIRAVVGSLPRSLRDQVADYVASVDAAADAIFVEAAIEQTPQLRDDLLLVATLKKTLGIVASCFWAVDNSLALTLVDGTSAVRVGGATYSRNSERYTELRALHRDLENAVLELGLSDLVRAENYVEVLEGLANGRQ
jgi:hypothetical protein